jgi:hypothetical protein
MQPVSRSHRHSILKVRGFAPLCQKRLCFPVWLVSRLRFHKDTPITAIPVKPQASGTLQQKEQARPAEVQQRTFKMECVSYVFSEIPKYHPFSTLQKARAAND